MGTDRPRLLPHTMLLATRDDARKSRTSLCCLNIEGESRRQTPA